MALQTSGQISLSDMASEFNDTAPHALSEFYGASDGVPTSGQFKFSQMYGAANLQYYYNTGDEITSITGGWRQVRNTTSNSSHALVKYSTYMDFYALHSAGTGAFIVTNGITNNSITIPAGHTQLKAEIQVIERSSIISAGFGLKSSGGSGTFSPSVNPGGVGSRTISLNVSSGATGYVSFWWYGGQHARGRLYIKKVWSE